jgi:hypothetical protein
MEAVLAIEMPAGEVRERLAGFVLEAAGRPPLRRQRENALLYVRGLVELGGRSYYPRLLRVGNDKTR